jgi:hypothetical protein
MWNWKLRRRGEEEIYANFNTKQKTRVVYDDAKVASFSVYSATGKFKKKIINYSFFN